MKEGPILMCGEMVVATLNDLKSQTRRIAKVPSWCDSVERVGSWFHFYGDHPGNPCEHPKCAHNPGKGMFTVKCPYGVEGDRLWVRETWQSLALLSKGQYDEGPCYRATGHAANCKCHGHLWRPSIFMPRALSRITLEIVSVRVERLQEISEADAIAEGVEEPVPTDGVSNEEFYKSASFGPFQDSYRALWNTINGAGSWALNPWVWVVEFRRILP